MPGRKMCEHNAADNQNAHTYTHTNTRGREGVDVTSKTADCFRWEEKEVVVEDNNKKEKEKTAKRGSFVFLLTLSCQPRNALID